MKSKMIAVVFSTAIAFIFAAGSAATADVVTYSVSGSFANGATFLSGSILTIDTTAGTVSNSNLLVSAGNNPSPANTFTDANLIQNGSFQTPFDWGLADGTDLTMFAAGGTEFQNFSPLGGPVALVTYFGPWPGTFSGGSFDTVLTLTPVAVPGPVAGAGLPGFLLASGGLLAWWRRKRLSYC